MRFSLGKIWFECWLRVKEFTFATLYRIVLVSDCWLSLKALPKLDDFCASKAFQKTFKSRQNMLGVLPYLSPVERSRNFCHPELQCNAMRWNMVWREDGRAYAWVGRDSGSGNQMRRAADHQLNLHFQPHHRRSNLTTHQRIRTFEGCQPPQYLVEMFR